MKNFKKAVSRVLFISFLIFLFGQSLALAKWHSEVKELVFVNRTRLNITSSEEEVIKQVEEQLYVYDSFADAPQLIPVSEQQEYAKSLVTRKEAMEDTEFLFQLLKFGYAGYQFYGGDERFSSAKAGIIEELQSEFPNRFRTGEFEELLYKHLNFINDGHFDLGKRNFLQRQVMYLDFNNDFLRDDQGYYLEKEEERYYLTEVNSNDPAEFIHPALNDEGAIVYRVGALNSIGTGPYPFELRLSNGEEEHVLNLEIEQIDKSLATIDYWDIYKSETIQGIPVITVSHFPNQAAEMKKFYEDAIKLKDEETIIIDLRYNFGGFNGHILNWLDNFTDEAFVSPGFIKASLRTPTSMQLVADYWERLGDLNMVEHIRNIPLTETGWSEIGYQPAVSITNNVKVVVLTGYTPSAGEFFVNSLMNLDNVVVLGINTEGLVLTAFPYTHPLPNSGITIRFAAEFAPQPDFVNREGIGYLPDFWINPEDALDLAIKFINNYGK